MKDTWEIVLGGVGGQGLIFAGLLLGEAAVNDGKNAAQTQSYGIETRGGFSKSELVVSTGEIVYPAVTSPDLVVILAKTAFDRLVPGLPEKCLVLFDSSAGPGAGEPPAGKGDFHPLPLIDEARRCGSPHASNIVALGAVVGLTGLVMPESLEKALADRFSGESLESALRAFRAGISLAKE
ncbi:MAG: 2-oxoacid:acceptor oxidoreductase family protein [Firmicutes bacterium]|nr:2-oxoacid:acceptor oxidoreductase family protein [Bacillota bacterium]